MFTVAPDAMQLGAESEISFEVVYFWNELKGESHSMRNILTQTMQMDGAVKTKVAQHGGSYFVVQKHRNDVLVNISAENVNVGVGSL